MYALIDGNNFYVSCHRVFQPGLSGRKVVVLSNNDGNVISRSEEVKPFVEMGEPIFQLAPKIKELDIAVFSSLYQLYHDMSGRLMRIVGRFVPQIEVYSIDEVFADMHHLFKKDLFRLGVTMRETIKQYIGIPCCVGIAPTKTLAKMANKYAKKKHREVGVFMADTPEKIQEMLEWADVKDIWGVGKQYGNMLHAHGYHTAAQLVNAPEDFIASKMTVVGLRTLKELKGIPSIPWVSEDEELNKKNICTSRSFEHLTSERRIIESALAAHVTRCAEKLRRQNSVAKEVNVFIHTNQFRKEMAQYHRGVTVELEMASNDTPTLIKAALCGLDKIWRDGYKFMKCGVIVMDLAPASQVQGSLFQAIESKSKINTLMKVIDGLNDTYGRDKVKVATVGKKEDYAMRHNYPSPSYTTRITDIIKANVGNK